jgi:phytoene dehydrogenase-like protein
VCLLEANDDLGGAARTLESTLPGFKHDFGAAFFPLVAPSPRSSGATWPPTGLRFVHAPVPAAHPFPGNQAIALGRSALETAASIDKVHLGDGAPGSPSTRRSGGHEARSSGPRCSASRSRSCSR